MVLLGNTNTVRDWLGGIDFNKTVKSLRIVQRHFNEKQETEKVVREED